MAKRDKEIERYKRALGIAMDALNMYASPDSYFAIGFGFDRPCGDFADDFSRVKLSDYNRPMPGKIARAAIRKLQRSYGGLGFYSQAAAHLK